MSIKFQFVLGAGFSSSVIAWFGGGDNSALGFSHVDCMLPDGRLLGARSDWVGGAPPGVRIRPSGYEAWKRRVVFELASTPAQEKLFYDFLMAQVGKPYDKLAIFSFIADRDWRDDSAWFCSELAAAASEHAGACDALYLPANKLSPTAWAVVVSALGGIAQ
jgi:hypothetical protein